MSLVLEAVGSDVLSGTPCARVLPQNLREGALGRTVEQPQSLGRLRSDYVADGHPATNVTRANKCRLVSVRLNLVRVEVHIDVSEGSSESEHRNESAVLLEFSG